MHKKEAVNLIRANREKFADRGDGIYSLTYYGSVLTYVIVRGMVHCSCTMRNGDFIEFEIKKGDLFS